MNVPAKKSLGQNFLVNKGILDKIIRAADISPKDTILEIGPGTGLLTELLAKTAGLVVAVEKDHRLVEPLRQKFRTSNVQIIEEDILRIDISRLNLEGSKYKIVANIPYYITGRLLRTIFEDWPQPSLIVLMVQKEVAQRITAKPGDMNLLALSVQLFADASVVAPVSRGSFRPIPKVDSAIIRLEPQNMNHGTKTEAERILVLAKKAFGQKRKQVLGALSSGLGIERTELTGILKEAGIDPQARPETLSISKWKELNRLLPPRG